MSSRSVNQSFMGGDPSFYNLPEFFDADGVPLVRESSTQQCEWHGCPDTGDRDEEKEKSDVDDVGSEFIMDTLLHQYRHLGRMAQRYMCTTERALSQLRQKHQRMLRHDRSLFHRAELIQSAALSPIIKLNVGGVRFEVHRDTLMQFPNTIFHLLDGEQFAVQRDDFGYIFLDRDPWLFREILFLLRERRQKMMEDRQSHSSLPHFCSVGQKRLAQLPPVERSVVIEEARYYGLNELISEVLRKRFHWRKCMLVPFLSLACRANAAEIFTQGEQVPPPEGCCFASCVRLNDNVYIFGGCSEHKAVLGSFYQLRLECDTANGEGEEGEEGEEVQQHGEALNREEDHEEGEGSVGGNPPAVKMQCVSYDLINPCVDRDVPVPDARSGHAMVSLHGRYILLFYGNDLYRHLSDVWAYHTTRNTWTQVRVRGSPLQARSGHTVTVVQNRLYLIGGKRLFEPRGQIFAEVFEGSFDAERLELTWCLVSCQQERRRPFADPPVEAVEELVREEENGEETCFPPAVAYHSAVEYAGRYIIVIGGLVGNSGSRHVSSVGGVGQWNNVASATPVANGGAPSCLYQLDTVNATWRRLHASLDSPSLVWTDIPRSGHIALRHHDDVYVIGSYAAQRQLRLFKLSLSSLTWRQVETTVAPGHGLPCERALPSGVVLPSTAGNQHPVILLYGGYSALTRQYFDDAYVITL